MAKFEDKLAMLLRQRGLTQTSLGKKLGLSPQSVNHWITGIRTPLPEYWDGLSQVVRADPVYLQDETIEILPVEEIDRRFSAFEAQKLIRSAIEDAIAELGEAEALKRLNTPPPASAAATPLPKARRPKPK